MKTLVALLLLVLLPGCLFQEASLQNHQRALRLVDEGTRRLRAGDFDRAEAAFTTATELSPEAAAIDGLGCVAFRRKQYQTAERLFTQAYEMDSSYYDSLTNLALLYEVQGRNHAAERVYREALRAMPENARLRNNVAGFLLRVQHQGSAARRELLKAESLSKDALIAENVHRIEEGE